MQKEKREDRRTARICAIIANVNRDSKKRPRAFTEEDFTPLTPEEQRERSRLNALRVKAAMETRFTIIRKNGDHNK